MDTADALFQLHNADAKGSLMEQAEKLKKKIRGKVYRYRAFVRPDADTNLLNIVLRGPALSIVRVASLPTPGQKISLEAVTGGGRNPQGLVFISGQGVNRNENVSMVKPMVEMAFDNIDKAVKAAGVFPADVLTVTCYSSSLQDHAQVQQLAATRYRWAVFNHVQIPMPYGRALVECEAVARAIAPVGFLYPEGLTKSPNFTQVVGISSRRMVWSGLHTSQGCTADGVRGMFRSLEATLKNRGASIKDAAFSYVYPNTTEGTDLSRNIRFDFYNKEKAPASTLIPFSGFVDKNACTGVEVVAPGS
ncbi:MAG: RidA family protein [Candidatus Solibacter usitatus]|nr:RidA family protein [Candidatus Solibacter usitatus]